MHPDRAVVRAAVADYRPAAPAGYGIELGVAAEGRTLLVGLNDGYSLGHVRLPPVPNADPPEACRPELVSDVADPTGEGVAVFGTDDRPLKISPEF